MSKKPDKQNPLRKNAGAQDARAPLPQAQARPAVELLHERRLNRAELEMQNEELRRAQAALEESRDRYVELYELAPVGYLTLTDSGVIDEINLAGAALLGEKRQRLARRRFARFVAAEDGDRWHRFFLGALHHDDCQRCELALQRGDGSRIPVRLDCMRWGGSSETSQIRITLTDISQGRQTELAISRREERFRAILDQVIVGIGQADLAGHITFVNGHFSRIIGYSREELLGMRWQDLTHPEDLRQNWSLYKQILSEAKPFSFEKRYVRKNGESVWVSIGASLLHDDEGHAVGVLAAVVDISERKQAEELLKKSSAEIEDLITMPLAVTTRWTRTVSSGRSTIPNSCGWVMRGMK